MIVPSDHHNWFHQGLLDRNRLLLILTSADGCPLGQIRFDRQQIPLQDNSAEVFVDLSLDRCARGFGLAVNLVRMGLQVMEQTWGHDIEVVAEVLMSNQASNACFSRSGFTKEPISPAAPLSEGVNRWRFRPVASRS